MDAAARILGDTADELGGSVSCAGDTDGDGVEDLLVGGEYAAGMAGGAWLRLGPVSGDIASTAADAIFTGDAAGDGAGRDVAGGGDIDGDGYDDLVVASGTLGVVSVVLGPTASASLPSEADAAIEGSSYNLDIKLDEDLDGDGRADLLVGSYDDDLAWLVRGPVEITSFDDADAIFEGGGCFGSAVSSTADLDGDGAADVAITDLCDAELYLFGGATSGTFDVETDAWVTLTWVGAAAMARTTDFDGGEGLLVGEPSEDVWGAVWVFGVP